MNMNKKGCKIKEPKGEIDERSEIGTNDGRLVAYDRIKVKY